VLLKFVQSQAANSAVSIAHRAHLLRSQEEVLGTSVA
jgi:hypothetical protein